MTTTQNTISVGLCLLANSATGATERILIARWQKEYDSLTFKAARRQKIIDAVREGYDTYSEISTATAIPPATVRRVIEKLPKTIIRSVLVKKNVSNRSISEFRFEIVDAEN